MEDQQAQDQSGGDPRTSSSSPSAATQHAERAEAGARAGADRPPSEEERRIADEQPDVSDEQRAHAEEMLDLGANQQGEGRIG